MTKGKDKVTDAQIEAYYNKNKSRFSSPERRDLRIVLTKDKAKAAAGQEGARLRASRWKSVAKKYSVDQASKTKGGALPGVAKGQQEPAFDKAIFAAKKGKLTGPVKTQFGWYVFDVSKITAEQAADARGVQGLDQADPRLPEPAERAEEVRRRLPQPVQEGDGLPQGLRRRRLQERAEEEGRARRRTAPPRARPQQQGTDDDLAVGRAPAATSRLRHACQSQPSPPPSPAWTS